MSLNKQSTNWKEFPYIVYLPKTDQVLATDHKDIIRIMYFQLARIPTIEQLRNYWRIHREAQSLATKGFDSTQLQNPEQHYIKILRDNIKLNDKFVPLYDYFTDNVYPIKVKDIFRKVNQQFFRLKFHDEFVERLVRLTKEYKWLDRFQNVDTSKFSESLITNEAQKNKAFKIDIFMEYNKLRKISEFLNHFDRKYMKYTFYKYYFKHSDTGRRITNIPQYPQVFNDLQIKQCPYIDMQQLLQFGVNENLLEDADNITSGDIKNIASRFIEKQPQLQELQSHREFSQKTNIYNIIKYYCFIGSKTINEMLAQPKVPRDRVHSQIIKAILGVQFPQFKRSYVFFRFVNSKRILHTLQPLQHVHIQNVVSVSRAYYHNLNEEADTLVVFELMSGNCGLFVELFSPFYEEQEVLLQPASFQITRLVQGQRVFFHPIKALSRQINKVLYLKQISRQPSITNSKGGQSKQEEDMGVKDIIILKKGDDNFSLLFDLAKQDGVRKISIKNGTKHEFYLSGLVEYGGIKKILGTNDYFILYTLNELFPNRGQQVSDFKLDVFVEVSRDICFINYHNIVMDYECISNDVEKIAELMIEFFGCKCVIVFPDYRGRMCYQVEDIIDKVLKKENVNVIFTPIFQTVHNQHLHKQITMFYQLSDTLIKDFFKETSNFDKLEQFQVMFRKINTKTETMITFRDRIIKQNKLFARDFEKLILHHYNIDFNIFRSYVKVYSKLNNEEINSTIKRILTLCLQHLQ